jgi:hypothetical protein
MSVSQECQDVSSLCYEKVFAISCINRSYSLCWGGASEGSGGGPDGKGGAAPAKQRLYNLAVTGEKEEEKTASLMTYKHERRGEASLIHSPRHLH